MVSMHLFLHLKEMLLLNVGDTATGQLLPVASTRFLGTTTKTTTLQVNARF